MPTILREKQQRVVHNIVTIKEIGCCSGWKSINWNGSAWKIEGRKVYYQNREVTNCLYCGERVLVTLDVIPPKGFMRRA